MCITQNNDPMFKFGKLFFFIVRACVYSCVQCMWCRAVSLCISWCVRSYLLLCLWACLFVESSEAVGSVEWPNGTFTEAVITDLGWGNPMGGLFSSSRDVAQWVRAYVPHSSFTYERQCSSCLHFTLHAQVQACTTLTFMHHRQ